MGTGYSTSKFPGRVRMPGKDPDPGWFNVSRAPDPGGGQRACRTLWPNGSARFSSAPLQCARGCVSASPRESPEA